MNTMSIKLFLLTALAASVVVCVEKQHSVSWSKVRNQTYCAETKKTCDRVCLEGKSVCENKCETETMPCEVSGGYKVEESHYEKHSFKLKK
ncbi:unnamed protein product [Calicophoron daubneyi]|uniref:Uncharacterized protein n=1 Tax=Calicophoron daubneyi TaxID=300641 RepID=A0AAV2TCP0_CALDB